MLEANITISRDNRILNTHMLEKEYSVLQYLVQKCIKHSITYSIVETYMITDINRLKRDNLLLSS